MILGLFESDAQRRKDDRDLDAIHRKYGDGVVEVLDERVNDTTLSGRDRKHWARLLRKARQRFRD